jgi:glutamine synthetase
MTILKNFIDKLSDHLQKDNQLAKIIEQLKVDFGLIACLGVEIEFYLSPNIDPVAFENLLDMKLKKEKGVNQFEIDLPPSTNIINYIAQINSIKSKIAIIAKKLDGSADLSAKPFLEDYGNSMHFHVNFIDSNISQAKLSQSICHYMLDSFLVLTPYQNDYLRFDKNFMAPINVSFGNNNRTVAVRIPDLSPKRLEYRLANPLTNCYIAIFTIFNSILLGLKFPDKINNISKIYGNAFDQQYQLIPLPSSSAEALRLFKLEFFMPNILALHETRHRDAANIESMLAIIKTNF